MGKHLLAGLASSHSPSSDYRELLRRVASHPVYQFEILFQKGLRKLIHIALLADRVLTSEGTILHPPEGSGKRTSEPSSALGLESVLPYSSLGYHSHRLVFQQAREWFPWDSLTSSVSV